MASFDRRHVIILAARERLAYLGKMKKKGEYVRNHITPEPAVDELAAKSQGSKEKDLILSVQQNISRDAFGGSSSSLAHHLL